MLVLEGCDLRHSNMARFLLRYFHVPVLITNRGQKDVHLNPHRALSRLKLEDETRMKGTRGGLVGCVCGHQGFLTLMIRVQLTPPVRR